MKRLIKAEFKRIFKDKISLIGFLIAIGLTLFALLMNVLLFKLLGALFGDAVGINGQTIYKMSFSPGNNAGMLLLIFGAVILLRDLRQNTIRQKIIAGHKRSHVYFSSIIVHFIYGLGILMITALINFGLGTAIFGYGATFDVQEAVNFILSTILGLLAFSVFYSLALFFAFLTRSTGGTIGILIGVIFAFSILDMAISGLSIRFEWLQTLLKFSPSSGFNVLMNPNFEYADILFPMTSAVFYITATIVGGYFIFEYQDIK